jgi:limonene-1,2-epoxide hydrolase
MSTHQTAVAESFSRHEFSSTYSHLAADIQWHNVGGVDHVGRDAVISACNDASAYFDRSKAAVTIRRTVTAANVVVIEAVGSYADDEGVSRVASCDVYEFRDGQLTAVTSYNIELAE